MRRFVLAITCLCATGCGALAWPAINVTPPMDLNASDTHAYRSETRYSTGWFCTLSSVDRPTSVVAEIPVSGDRLGRQVSVKASWYLGLILVGGKQTNGFDILLYRPGYETVTVRGWPWWWSLGYAFPTDIQWKKIDNLAEQETVLIELERKLHDSTDAKHCQFLTQEHRRLAELAQDNGPISREYHRKCAEENDATALIMASKKRE